MKRFLAFNIFAIICIISIYSFDIETESLVEWNRIGTLYKNYIESLNNVKTIEEIESIEKVFNIKLNATLQDKIHLKYVQEEYIHDNILEITSVIINELEIANGKINCNIALTFKAKINILQEEYTMNSKILYEVEKEQYNFSEIVIFDNDWEVLAVSKMEIKPKILFIGQTGLIVLRDLNLYLTYLDYSTIKNGKIITLR